MDLNTINDAFDFIVSEMEKFIESLKREANIFFQKEDFEESKKIIENAHDLSDFKREIELLQYEWKNQVLGKKKKRRKSKRKIKKISKGLKTPLAEFRLPILEVIIEMGGHDHADAIIKKVGQKMKGVLNKYDYERLESDNVYRWVKSVQWCRYKLTKEGLLKNNSPRGIWEITKMGEEYYKRYKG